MTLDRQGLDKGEVRAQNVKINNYKINNIVMRYFFKVKMQKFHEGQSIKIINKGKLLFGV